MSFEEKFLEIYRVLVDEDLGEFYSSDIAPEVDFEAGTVGKAVYNVIENYDLPIDADRESPGSPSLFIIEEFLPYSEVESMLDTSKEERHTWEAIFNDVRDRLEGKYENTELNKVLRAAAEDYYDNNGDRFQGRAKVKSKLEQKGIIEGDTVDGWKVKDSS
ncbi:MAG: hypothetical protein R6V35_04280 [Candidatus Nanohaloarchaea archaeon]